MMNAKVNNNGVTVNNVIAKEGTAMDTTNIFDLKVADLRKLAKKVGVQKYSRMKKEDLITAIKEELAKQIADNGENNEQPGDGLMVQTTKFAEATAENLGVDVAKDMSSISILSASCARHDYVGTAAKNSILEFNKQSVKDTGKLFYENTRGEFIKPEEGAFLASFKRVKGVVAAEVRKVKCEYLTKIGVNGVKVEATDDEINAVIDWLVNNNALSVKKNDKGIAAYLTEEQAYLLGIKKETGVPAGDFSEDNAPANLEELKKGETDLPYHLKYAAAIHYLTYLVDSRLLNTDQRFAALNWNGVAMSTIIEECKKWGINSPERTVLAVCGDKAQKDLKDVFRAQWSGVKSNTAYTLYMAGMTADEISKMDQNTQDYYVDGYYRSQGLI